MTILLARRLGVGWALLVGLGPVMLAAAPGDPPLQTFTGKVVRLAEWVEKHGGKLDADAAPVWLALATDDGRLYPLVKDAGSRMFFTDPALLNRPMRLTGRLLPGSPLLQVLQVHSIVRGQVHEVYYWCDICAIKRFEKMACECCGGPMELREVPLP
ncbi:MAG: hypothetical protein NZ700_05425 [Gemmataceae bacterium]|nr:hypothetical protein [Gemmataceae bacterium]MDW8264770.1 hypothetical protein [Gemmataceae bacterium]